MKKIILIILSVLLGMVFVFSAYVKLYPIELFELTFIDAGISNWVIAPYIARLFIATEFFLGFLLIFNLYLNRITLKLTLCMLVLFTVYLIILILTEGNSGNCKCFGNFISLTPLESIVKNIIMAGIIFILYKFHKGFQFRFSRMAASGILIISLALPFILNPPDAFISEKIFNADKVNYDLGLDVLYNNPKVKAPAEELRKGKHIIAFMSMTCPHCRIGAYKLHIIKKKNPGIPMFIILNGDIEDLKPFEDDTKATNIPYTILLGQDFIKIAGVQLPAIFWVNNGQVEKRTNYFQLNQAEIENWLKE